MLRSLIITTVDNAVIAFRLAACVVILLYCSLATWLVRWQWLSWTAEVPVYRYNVLKTALTSTFVVFRSARILSIKQAENSNLSNPMVLKITLSLSVPPTSSHYQTSGCLTVQIMRGWSNTRHRQRSGIRLCIWTTPLVEILSNWRGTTALHCNWHRLIVWFLTGCCC